MLLIRRATRAVGLLACGLAVAGVAAPSAHADAELTVSPLIIDVEAAAGDTLTQTITAAATGTDPVTIELVHADFGFGDDYQVVLIRDDAKETTAFSTRDWFSLPKDQYVIPAGQSRDLPLRIEVPENTPGGTYLGAALLRVVPPPATGGGSQVQAVPETGPLLFIAVEGGDPPQAAMKRFDVPRLVSGGPIRPKLQIENRGDEFFTFEGTIELSGPGKDRTIDVSRQYVVPGDPRTIRTSADEKGTAGIPKLGTKGLEMGRYTVKTRLRIEPVGTTLVASRTVWVIPTGARIAGAVIVLVFIVCVWFLARWLSHQREVRRLMREELAAGPDTPVQEASDDEQWDEDDPDDGDDLLDEESDDELLDEDDLDELSDEDDDYR